MEWSGVEWKRKEYSREGIIYSNNKYWFLKLSFIYTFVIGRDLKYVLL